MVVRIQITKEVKGHLLKALSIRDPLISVVLEHHNLIPSTVGHGVAMEIDSVFIPKGDKIAPSLL